MPTVEFCEVFDQPEVVELNIDEQIKLMIDVYLSQIIHQHVVSSTEVINFLLDIRNLLLPKCSIPQRGVDISK